MEYEPWSSKIGFQVVPALVVFQRLPLPTATYQVLWSFGWTAMSATLPDISAGPMPRSSSPLKVAAFIRDASSSCLPFFAALAGKQTDTTNNSVSSLTSFILTSSSS
jgi:hypothetical protein